jgi:hypothetical protein
VSLVCCDAGKAAHPEPCPWHPGDHGPDPGPQHLKQAAQNDPTRMGGQGGNVSGLVGRSGWPIGSRRTQLPQGMGTVVVQGDGIGGQGGGASATYETSTPLTFPSAGLHPPKKMDDLTRIVIGLVAEYGDSVEDGAYKELRVPARLRRMFVEQPGAHITVADDGRGGWLLSYTNDAMKEAADGEQQGREARLRVQEPASSLSEHQREQDEAGADSQRGEDVRGSEPDGEEGSSNAPTPPIVPDHAFNPAFGTGSGCAVRLRDGSTYALCGRPAFEHADDWPDHTRQVPVMDQVRRGRGGRGEDPPPGKFTRALLTPADQSDLLLGHHWRGFGKGICVEHGCSKSVEEHYADDA